MVKEDDMITKTPVEELQIQWPLYEALKQDADISWTALKDNWDSQVLRRVAIKSTFSFIEGVTYLLKRLSLSLLAYQEVPKRLSAVTKEELAEIAMLREKSYELNDKGDVKLKDAHLSLVPNLKFTFKIFSRIVRRESPIDPSSHDWQKFKDTLQVRDRLTHPKQLSSLDVTDEEILKANQVYNWFHDCFTSVFRFESEEIKADTNELK